MHPKTGVLDFNWVGSIKLNGSIRSMDQWLRTSLYVDITFLFTTMDILSDRILCACNLPDKPPGSWAGWFVQQIRKCNIIVIYDSSAITDNSRNTFHKCRKCLSWISFKVKQIMKLHYRYFISYAYIFIISWQQNQFSTPSYPILHVPYQLSFKVPFHYFRTVRIYKLIWHLNEEEMKGQCIKNFCR